MKNIDNMTKLRDSMLKKADELVTLVAIVDEGGIPYGKDAPINSDSTYFEAVKTATNCILAAKALDEMIEG